MAKKRIISLLAVAALIVSSFATFASAAFNSNAYAYVTGSNVNLRTNAGTSQTSLGLLQVNDVVIGVGANGSEATANGYTWDKVKVHSVANSSSSANVNKTGWTVRDYLQWNIDCPGC
jgi:hypothetical protein